MVESSGLLNRRRVKSSTGGSNPPLSARTSSKTPMELGAFAAARHGSFLSY